MNLSRRNFLASSVAALAMKNSFAMAVDYLSSEVEPDIIIELTAYQRKMSFFENLETDLWSFKGKVLKGPREALSILEDSYLGPTLQFHTGDKVRIIFKNELPESSIVHWHGLDVSHENDGHPHFAIKQGERYEYNFEIQNRAGMYWYHPHPHGQTGKQVFNGLAGLFIVRDKKEASLALPSGEQELSFVIQDRLFTKEGKIDYRPTMMGAHGNRLMINGRLAGDTIKVKKGTYRIRLLNGSNARIYNLAQSDGELITQIGSDGGLLGSPHNFEMFLLAPAERVDLIMDFSKLNTGETLSLDMYALNGKFGDDSFPVLTFEVEEERGRTHSIPKTLAPYRVINKEVAVNRDNPKVFNLVMVHGKGWTINGLAYEHNKFEDYEVINFGDTEIWEFYNPTGMPHPMHIHGTQFQILNRKSGQFTGTLDEGLKDTVLVMPGDRVQVIKEFNTFKGVFIYHCHNLEHEDFSMMRNFKIVERKNHVK